MKVWLPLLLLAVQAGINIEATDTELEERSGRQFSLQLECPLGQRCCGRNYNVKYFF